MPENQEGKIDNQIECKQIQWSKTWVDVVGNLICPECKQPAELVLGFFCNPCYAHKIEKKEK